MESDEGILNSCRVCRVPNQEGEFEHLYNDVSLLTSAGQLYEELIGEKIEVDTADFYPQYLCNSCDLQMKLFKKLKTKANKTLQDLKKHHEISQKENFLEDHQEKDVDDLILILKGDAINGTELNPQDEEDEDLSTEQQLIKVEVECQQNEQKKSEVVTADFQEQYINEKTEITPSVELIESDCKLVVETFEYMDDNDSEVIDNQLNNKETNENHDSNENSCDLVPENFEEFLPVEDELTDLDTLDTQNGYVEILDETSQETTAANTDENIFLDVHYLDFSDKDEKFTRKKHFCRTCNIMFFKRVDYQKHRKQKHSSKFPCPECAKVFQTSDALRVHLNLHRGLPPYQCELCNKTFNQKVHLNYHMDKHNNVRNFKCEVCGKAFIAKGDLAIHMRCHTNERRYACDICNKEFLMHEHMKNHRFSHFDKKFECKICKQKFVSPSTLRTHMKSIHEDEPRFQCEYCVKKFRRKHHLEAHYKVHRKLIAVSVEEYEDAMSHCDEEPILIVTEDVTINENTQVQEDNTV